MTKQKLDGFAAELRDYALSLPKTTEDYPWGERAFKVMGKAFVFLNAEELSFSMKLPQTGYQALTLPFAGPTHYGLGKHGWVTFKPSGRISKALKQQFLDWALESYKAVAPRNSPVKSPEARSAFHLIGTSLAAPGNAGNALKNRAEVKPMARQNAGTQSRGSTTRTTGSTTKGSGQTAQSGRSGAQARTQSGTQTRAQSGVQKETQRSAEQRTDREQALNVSREQSNTGSTDNAAASSGSSTRTAMGAPNTAANQTQPARADGVNAADRNAESSILPALMSNPWLMTNAFLSNPFGFARAMNQEMDRLFSGTPADVSPYSGQSAAGSRDSRSLDVSRPQRGTTRWAPQVEVRHNGNQLTVCADLPGLTAKDIDIQIDDGVLTISGERHQSTEDNREGYYRSERSYGAFSRSIALPDGVNEDQVRAKFDNGVLEVTVPVPEQRQRGRRVEIQSGE